jgi:putative transposase
MRSQSSPLPVHAAPLAAALLDVAHLPRGTYRGDGRHRLLRRPDPHLPLALRIPDLRHARRELIQINVTDHPTAAWAAHQLVESFPEETAPKYLLRDRDAIYGDVFARRVKGLGIREVLIAPRAPWQNPFAERVIGSIRRECLDHVIAINERHLRRLLRSYLAYYNATRPHQSLRNQSPHPREVQTPAGGRIVVIPQVGGLHHRYQRAA